MTTSSEDEFLHTSAEVMLMSEPRNRVAFERDEGQEYSVGARVTVHPMSNLFRTLALNPSNGSYRVTRFERIRDVGWKALRVSLHLVHQPGSGVSLLYGGRRRSS